MHTPLLNNLLPIAAQVEPTGTPIWVPAFIIVLMLLLLWWGLTRNAIPTGTAVHDTHSHDTHEEHAETAVAETVAAPDDLKIIEGIGPKIESILHDAGIRTLAQLAATDVSQLEQIVREDAGIRIAYPDTWPEQAHLAHEGQWDALETLQEELKGGRHVE